MTSPSIVTTIPSPEPRQLQADLIRQLEALRLDLLAFEEQCGPWLARVQPRYRTSARNLLHVTAFHRLHHPGLERQLREQGLSSLVGCEAHLLASLNAVIARLTPTARPKPPAAPLSPGQAKQLLEQHAERLFGAAPAAEGSGVMVTLPGETASDPALVRELVVAGMDIARISAAHGGLPVWRELAAAVRAAASACGRACRVSLDLAGPRPRTGALPEEPGVVDARPRRDRYGRLQQPALILALTPGSGPGELEGDTAVLPVLALPAAGLEPPLAPGDRFNGRDASGRMRELTLVERRSDGLLLGCRQHCRFTAGLRFRREGGGAELQVAALPPCAGELLLQVGDSLELTGTAAGEPAGLGRRCISCTLPEVFSQLQPGERVLIDQGKLEGVIREVTEQMVTVAITQAKPRGTRLRAHRSIDFPDSDLRLPALSGQDRQDIAAAVGLTDIVNYGPVDGGRGLEALQEELSALGGGQLGVVLKIETLEALAHLPCLLLTAMGRPQPVGVMIAREDLAAECGWEGLAALEQEILRLCAAAHVPCLRTAQGLEQAGPIAARVDLLRQIAAASLHGQPEQPAHLKPLLSRVRCDTGC